MGISNKRLNLIGDYIDDEIVYDIGSDHGYLPLKLLLEKKVKQIFICEKNQQPLDNAIKNFKLANRYNKDFFILSDGFIDIPEIKNNSSIVIAGMGGNLIAEIISGGATKLNQSHTLFLQPNNNTEKLRKYLNDNNFIITKELLVLENDIINEILIVKPDSNPKQLTDLELKFGISNKYDRDLFIRYWQNRLQHLERIKKQLLETNNTNPKVDAEITIITKKLGEI